LWLTEKLSPLTKKAWHSFALLQRFGTTKAPLRFYLFDLLRIGTENLLERPLSARRQRLEEEFNEPSEGVQLSPVLEGTAQDVLDRVREFEFEGVVAKRLDSVYMPGEEPGSWQKYKTQRSDDFLIGGYIPEPHGIDQLVVGEKRDGDFYYVEAVKNGFGPLTRRRVFAALEGKEIAACPFVNLPEKKGAHRMDLDKMKTVRWLEPKLRCEIAFNERTEQGHLRHSKFLRLRDPDDRRARP
jgi:ATP-dependent DNA ligase